MPTSSEPAEQAAADWRRALRACVDAFDAFASPSAIVFYRLDASGEPADFELFGMPEAMHRTYVARYRMLDPLHPSRCAAGERAVVTLSSELPDERRDASAYWTRFLRRHDVADVVEIWLRDAGRTVGAFSLLRFEGGTAAQGGDGASARFAPGEIDALARLQPIAEAALSPLLRARRGIHRIDCEARLTYREEQIARLVRDGRSNKEIARDLALGQPTIKTHLMRMYRKLGVSNRTELVGALFL
ncbi:helix-turn-helix transcriptional regulator [Burkholderia pseudomultivorans]|uniref:CsgBAC operon transcriptional regulatory protein n=1 Tax=Burkholderia pseudomultivorans TaxID=1207504 RepID=A0A6P2PX16_9BURK|nr:LuxR family transcriptional regulator [Burkholderia pseudomultivorans]MDR8727139.1 CsgBAC operon transcriptional regulatory protein [Burkholderia pseudomultivorans]MDR8733021.1 CsgBAC operon transcriptional regulatory protein [Burkholderia pseudomultivorans]MDR8739888.1 CsgBAC operon transcriptional regulatory protein [Burkholderia pseudomultivorans]MDR8756030.1 CsgBAC operon transcriptional regulatory protein [Burkholderia pseudomultivorans]MDR8775994.1 CsgBAC operon transcriptional regula